MAGDTEYFWLIAIIGASLLFIYLYIASIRKVLRTLGFTESEASAILFGTLLLGWITVPVFPYGGWWVGLSLGGAVIPIIICVNFLLKQRVSVGEAFIGITIVALITYLITRVSEDPVAIVADVPLAFAPALAAGLFAMSVFWADMSKAAPLAYVSGVLGTLVGADVFRLGEVLALDPPVAEAGADLFYPMLSIGGANIFDMVYLTGIIAVLIALVVLWLKEKQAKLGYSYSPGLSEYDATGRSLPYAKDVPPPERIPVRKGKLQ